MTDAPSCPLLPTPAHSCHPDATVVHDRHGASPNASPASNSGRSDRVSRFGLPSSTRMARRRALPSPAALTVVLLHPGCWLEPGFVRLVERYLKSRDKPSYLLLYSLVAPMSRYMDDCPRAISQGAKLFDHIFDPWPTTALLQAACVKEYVRLKEFKGLPVRGVVASLVTWYQSRILGHPRRASSEYDASLTIQRMLRGTVQCKNFQDLRRAVSTVQRMERGNAVRRSIAAVSAELSTAAMSAAAAAATAAAALESAVLGASSSSCRPPPLSAAPAYAALEVSAAPLLQVEAQVAQSTCRGPPDALDAMKVQPKVQPKVQTEVQTEVQTSRGSSDALENAMKRLGPEALSVARRPRPPPPSQARPPPPPPPPPQGAEAGGDAAVGQLPPREVCFL